MGELLFVLIALGIVAFLIALVGHGMWLLMVAILRGIFGELDETTSAGRLQRRCPRCSALVPQAIIDAGGRCPNCSYAFGMPAQVNRQVELTIVERQLTQWHLSGAVAEEQWRDLQLLIQQERAQASGAAARAEHAAPVLPPAVASPPPLPLATSEKAPIPMPAARYRSAVPLAPVPAPAAAPPHPPVVVSTSSRPLESEALEQDEPLEIVPLEAEPRALSDLLQGFMEERNIRWGELVSGMLIVGSAIGLVISLWATLQQAIPYFPALLFLLVTAALHGAGLYTLRRWKLRATSRGLLVISTLLVPLNFLAAIALSDQRPSGDVLYLIAVGIGLAVFGAISASAARVLLRKGWLPLAFAVMGPCVGQLVISRYATPSSNATELTRLAVLPFVSFVAALAMPLWWLSQGRYLTRRRVEQAFLLLGVALFSLAVPVGLLVWKTKAIEPTLAMLAPWLSAAAGVVLCTGSIIHRRLTSSALATTRTAGTALAIAGGLALVAPVALAWPQPELLVAVGLVNFVVLTGLAFATGLAVLHVPAAAALGLVGLIGFHMLQGNLVAGGSTGGQVLEALLMGRSGVVLLVLASVLSASAGWLHRLGRSAHARAQLGSGVLLALVSAGIAVYSGFVSGVDGDLATLIFAIGALVILPLAERLRHPAVAWLGSGLLLLAVVHGIAWNHTIAGYLAHWQMVPARPLVTAGLIDASLISLLAAWTWFVKLRFGATEQESADHDSPFVALTNSALLVSAAALLLAGASLNLRLVEADAVYAFWGTALWLLLAAIRDSRTLVAAAQALGTLGVVFATTAVALRLPWWVGEIRDTRHIAMQLGALAVWSAVWSLARLALRGALRLNRLLATTQTSVDRVVLAGAVILVLVFAGLESWPGIAAELRPAGEVATSQPAATLIVVAVGLLVIGIVLSLASTKAVTFMLAVVAVAPLVPTFAFSIPDYGRIWLRGPPLADGPGIWLALLAAIIALVIALRERATLSTLCWLLLAGVVAPILVAGRFATDNCSASALQWGAAIYGLVIAGALWNRDRVARVATGLGWSAPTTRNVPIYETLRGLAVALSTLPVLLLTTRTIVELASGHRLAGPTDGSLFDRIGATATLTGPCWLLMAAAIVYAVRDRSPNFALAGSLLMQLGVGLAATAPGWVGGDAVDLADLIRMLQWCGVGLGAYGLAWLAVSQRTVTEESAAPPSLIASWRAIDFHQLLAVTLVAGLAVWAALAIMIYPAGLSAELSALGRIGGYVAVVVVAASWAFYARAHWPQGLVESIAAAVMAIVPLVAISLAAGGAPDDWRGYRMLSGGWSAFAVLAVAFGCAAFYRRSAGGDANLRLSDAERFPTFEQCRARYWSDPAIAWATAAGVAVVSMALRGEWHDPSRPWWSSLTTLVIALSAAAVAIRRRSTRIAYGSTLLAILAAGLFWLRPWLGLSIQPSIQGALNLVEAVLVAAALAGFFWLVVALYFQRERDTEFDTAAPFPPVHHTTAIGVLAVAALLAGSCLALDTLAITLGGSGPIDISNPGGWLMIGALTLLLAVSVWDRTATHALAALYAVGLIALTVDLVGLQLPAHRLLFAAGCAATGYVFLTGLVWTQREWILAFAEQMDVPRTTLDLQRVGSWLPRANVVLATLGVFVEFWVALTFDDWRFRIAAATAAALAVPGFAFLAQDARRERMQFDALIAAAVAAACFGWATMPVSGAPDYWLQRSVRLLVMLAATTTVYGVLLVRVLPAASSWFRSAWRAAATTGAAAVVSLLAVLVLEAVWFDPTLGAPITGLQIAVVAVVLVGLAGALVSLALLPGADPLNFSERGRMLYVYAAEAVLSLLFLHIYLTMPELFTGRIRQYWPFIAMGIAFAGVSVGELFERRGLRVLSEPLQKTGAFLPLLPAIGFWIHVTQVGPLRGDYSTLLFLGGLLYVMLSMWRKSFVYSIAAAIAGNGGLWALLMEHDLSLLARPQMWLIPPAASVLVAAQINRNRLQPAQLTAIRYLAVTVIYVTSTAEMFLTGVGESLWLPMVLAALSVAGVLAGILLRVRAFLYLGSSFLLLSIISMVWHAARNIGHVWPWWAFGIVLGLAILTLFGLFEKKRSEVEQVVSGLRQWER